ncbi:MAG: hypothetical protein IT457_19360 [Planctomycetes bacterium]|nr:hypothetical protein [Planctomycetota bacterium]
MSEGSDPASVQRFKDAIAAACRAQGALAQELWTTQPEHDRVPELLDIRWAGLTNALHAQDLVIAETRSVLLQEDLRSDARRAALLARAHAINQVDDLDPVIRLRAARELLAADLENERSGI